jgi:hypothetical protein
MGHVKGLNNNAVIPEFIQYFEDEDIFFTNYEKVYKLDEFLLLQKTTVNNLAAFLTQKWTIDVEETSKELVDIKGKKWNCSDSRESYQKSKMKPFVTVIKFMIQDSLTKIAQRLLMKFVKSIEWHSSDKVDLIRTKN